MPDGSEKAGQQMLELSGLLSKEPGLGCSLVAHRDLGFCGGCQSVPVELTAWRLLAMSERGIPPQPWEEPVCASGCIGACEGHDRENDD